MNYESLKKIYFVATLVLTLLFTPCAAMAQGEYASWILGPADPVAIDQPRVTVDVIDPVTLESLGPDYASQFLLDTGAQGIMAVGYAVTELNDNDYETDGVFYELGIGGLSVYDLSVPYRFDISGSDYARATLGTDIRILSKEDLNFGSFGGVVGMPAMVNRVTELNMPMMLGDENDPWGLGIGYIGVFFSQNDPPATSLPRYTVAVDVVSFPPPEQPDPNAPMPTYGPLPFITAGARHGNMEATGDFVLDTGAQVTMLSPALAFALGLDANNDGSLDDDAVGTTEFQGAGGVIEVPLLQVDKIVLPTNEGVDLVWTDLELPVYHVDDSIAGIFGSDLLDTGWFRAVFETRDTGAFEKIYLDFRNADTGSGEMVIDIASSYDQLEYIIHPMGDANRDGTVNLDDFILLKQNYGATEATWIQGDFNSDGTVGLDDFIILKQNYGSGQ